MSEELWLLRLKKLLENQGGIGGVETMPQKRRSNEGSSSAGSMRTEEPNAKRQRGGSRNCHQCHRNDKERVVRCTKCNKNYCIACISKWYKTMDETDVVDACPTCRDICNCAKCLQSCVANKDLLFKGLILSTKDKIQYSKYIVGVLLPSLKQFVAEQNMEREEEARIRGLSTGALQLQKSNFSPDDKRKCNNCQASIFDIHRSCGNCSYELCVTCCREIRDAFLSMDNSNSKWGLTEKGTIVCPTGCADLDLKSTYPEDSVLKLLIKAESIPYLDNLPGGTEDMERPCSCLTGNQGSAMGSGESSEAVVGSVEKSDLKHFQLHLSRGEPITVPNVLSGMNGLSWEPLVMWRACRKTKTANDSAILNFRVTNCLNWCEETMSMHQFFEGYSKGLFDSKGRLQTYKLEDWPLAEPLRERLPRHFLEFIRCLPFKHYTHPHAGYLNVPAKIPQKTLKPDWGPKMCFSNGVDSLTNLHYALSDRVSVLVHARSSKTENERKKRVDPCVSESRVPGIEGTEDAVIWDVFRRQDVPKLNEYLRKHCGEFGHSFPLQQLVHPVYEKAFYLTMEHKRNLKEEYGIEPWTFVQRLGDAVIVPAGCPHQIRNLKSCISVAVNFISPQSVGECIRLSTEYRCLPQNHRCREDKLQVKKMTLHAISQAVRYLDTINSNTSRIPITPPPGYEDVQHNPAQPKERPSFASMRKDLESMMLTLDVEGDMINKYYRAYLEKSIPNLLNRIRSMEESSSIDGLKYE